MIALIALAQQNTSWTAAHTAISWEAVTASSKMDYPYNILIPSLHGLQVRSVSQQIWCRCQVSLETAWQITVVYPVCLWLLLQTSRRAPHHLAVQQACISLRIRTIIQIKSCAVAFQAQQGCSMDMQEEDVSHQQ